jgi:cytochrome c oxidase assembly protein subunit 15
VIGIVAVVAVVAQGVIGGLRVILLADALAMVHGPLAQAFFALVVALALATSAPMARPMAAVNPGTRALTVATTLLVYAQIVFGALLTHGGRLDLHLGGALAVFVLGPMATARLRRTGDAVAAPAARLLLILLAAQLLLGAGAYLARFAAVWIPGGQLTMLAVPVAHRLVGGLILAAAVVMAVRVLAGARPAQAALPAPGVLGVAR